MHIIHTMFNSSMYTICEQFEYPQYAKQNKPKKPQTTDNIQPNFRVQLDKLVLYCHHLQLQLDIFKLSYRHDSVKECCR